MSDIQTGVNHIIAAANNELAARKIKGDISAETRGSTPDGVKITIVAGILGGKKVETFFNRRQIDNCLQGATVTVQIELKRIIGDL